MARAGLSPAVVVGAAAEVADGVGLDRLTLAAVAQRFGVKLPSLYKHVGGLDDLHRGVAVVGLRGLAEVLSTAVAGRAAGDALRAAAQAYRGYAVAYPGRYAATLRAPDPADAEHVAAAEAVLRIVFAVLAGYRLEGDAAIDATRILRSALHGFVTLEAAGGFGLPQDVDRSFAALVDALDAGFSAAGSRRPLQ